MDKNGMLLFTNLFQETTDILRSCVLVASFTWKLCMYSWFNSETASCILRNIFVSHFPTDFFQTKVYLFAQASSFVPSIKTVSFDSSPAFSNRFTI